MKGDAESSGDVVVAGACGAEVDGRGGRETSDALAGSSEDAEAFDEAGDVGSIEGVIAVLALRGDGDEALRGETLKVNAGGGGADFGDEGEFGAGAGVTVHERAQHAGAGGFGDGSGDAGDCGIERRRGVKFNGKGRGDGHCLMVDEGWLQSKRTRGGSD